MRFYPYAPWLRWSLIVVWSVLGLTALSIHPLRSPWYSAFWSVISAIQLSSLVCNFWEVTPTALIQHSLFYRRVVPAADLLYAGPVRRHRLLFLLRKSVEVTARNLPAPLIVNPGPARADFLHRLRELAPAADIIAAS